MNGTHGSIIPDCSLEANRSHADISAHESWLVDTARASLNLGGLRRSYGVKAPPYVCKMLYDAQGLSICSEPLASSYHTRQRVFEV